MGRQYRLKCSACDYSVSINEGVGMMHSPHAVFYGVCDDPTQNWSVAFPDGLREREKPLLLSLVKSTAIKKRAFALLQSGATPKNNYGHSLYDCPKCHRLYDRFYFCLKSENEIYEPDYKCPNCRTVLKKVDLVVENETLKIVHEDNSIADWHCPKCGNTSLENEDFMRMWD